MQNPRKYYFITIYLNPYLLITNSNSMPFLPPPQKQNQFSLPLLLLFHGHFLHLFQKLRIQISKAQTHLSGQLFKTGLSFP